MLALALVLLAVVAVLVVASFVGSSEEVVIEFLNITITTSVGAVFVSGFVAGLIALAALYAIRTSVRRSQRRRDEVRELRRQAERPTPVTADATGQENRSDEAAVRSEDQSRVGHRDQADGIGSGPAETSRDPSQADGEPPRRDASTDPELPPGSDPPRS